MTDLTLPDRLRDDRAGALAGCPGTDVVPPAAVQAGAGSEISGRARTRAAALTARRER